MSWKNIKEYYRIGHIVHVTAAGVSIGSPYVSDLIVIGPDGVIKKRYEWSGGNEDLTRYQREMDADPEKVRQLLQTPDTFGASVSVFTYDGGAVIEKRCEEPGWPNVTHDGALMYENSFSTDKSLVVKWAKRSARYGIESAHEMIADTEKTLAKYRERLASEQANLAKLDSEYPAILSDKK